MCGSTPLLLAGHQRAESAVRALRTEQGGLVKLCWSAYVVFHRRVAFYPPENTSPLPAVFFSPLAMRSALLGPQPVLEGTVRLGNPRSRLRYTRYDGEPP